MSEENQKLKMVFAPGVLEQLEAENTPEELQTLFDSLAESVDNGTLLNDSTPIDMNELFESDPDLYYILQDQLNKIGNDFTPPILH
jgi:hypothetical protein